MKENKLFKYILISILIHALILFVFPLANQAGFGDKNETQDFGFIELVEYKSITQTSQEAGEKQNTEDEKEQEETIEENKDIEKDKSNIEIDEDKKETETDEEIVDETSEKPSENEKNQISDNKSNTDTKSNTENESQNIEEVQEKSDSTSDNDNTEVISSEESEVEMEVEDKSQAKSENQDNEKAEEESESTTEKKSEEKANSSEQEQEEEEAPPPPPTSGELIAKSITPQYPKDLIGENKKGTVKFVVNINKTGELANITMTDSSGIEQIDKTSRLAIERGWEFKSYNMPYSIPIVVDFKINEAGNPVIDLNLGEVNFKEVNG